jgi:outer membrane protein OmpA-like peptidoglycan-associated protein
MEAQPLANTLLTGSVRDEQGNPFQRGIVSIIDMDNGIEVAPKYLNNEGSFEFDLINNTEYLLVVQGEEFFRIEEIFFLDGDTNLDLVTQSITSRLKFASIEFDEASAELKTTMYRDLDRVANFLLDNRDFKVRISGHTDSDGSADFNMQLSQQRAQAIADYLIYFGRIAAARIEVYGLGSTQPIVEEKTEADKALNRRVEFELFRPSKEELDKMQQEIKEENNDGW